MLLVLFLSPHFDKGNNNDGIDALAHNDSMFWNGERMIMIVDVYVNCKKALWHADWLGTTNSHDAAWTWMDAFHTLSKMTRC